MFLICVVRFDSAFFCSPLAISNWYASPFSVNLRSRFVLSEIALFSCTFDGELVSRIKLLLYLIDSLSASSTSESSLLSLILQR